jgi:hypothetical protein
MPSERSVAACELAAIDDDLAREPVAAEVFAAPPFTA